MKKTAEDLAKEVREISVSEFFEKNKHLLGFDNPVKALVMAVKEAVDNSLDACEEAEILPEIIVKIKELKEENVYSVSVEDNGPGIVKENIPRVFGKLLYGSKFHKIKQNRGQQGLGISTTVLYSQLTTGTPAKIWSRTSPNKPTYYYEILIDTKKNEPIIEKEEIINNGIKERGTKVEVTLVGKYRKQVETYLKYTSLSNPFARIIFYTPTNEKIVFERSANTLPKPAKEIKPHPYGVEFWTLVRLISETRSRNLLSFLVNEFSSVGEKTAKEICKLAKLSPDAKPQSIEKKDIERLLEAMQKVKIQRPPIDCLSPIGEEELNRSLKRMFPDAEFIATITREPEVYRGFPFIVEAGVVYGTKDSQEFELIRFANKVPLIYQQGACAITEAVKEIDWKRYGIDEVQGIPNAPLKLVVHLCSVWVPFVSESKNAIASYPEIVKEIKLAIQQVARKLAIYLSGKRKAYQAKRRMEIFYRYGNEVASSISYLTERKLEEVRKKIFELIEKKVGKEKLEEIEEQS
ncbi:MAG: DNA topoisomerase VI subunit B [Candidatus Aenigmatarchaeota archaeon]